MHNAIKQIINHWKNKNDWAAFDECEKQWTNNEAPEISNGS